MVIIVLQKIMQYVYDINEMIATVYYCFYTLQFKVFYELYPKIKFTFLFYFGKKTISQNIHGSVVGTSRKLPF